MNCICQRENVPDPEDVNWKEYGRQYPKTVLQITFSIFCDYSNHAERGRKNEVRLIRFLDNGGVEDVK
jgi:hypothetical protein